VVRARLFVGHTSSKTCAWTWYVERKIVSITRLILATRLVLETRRLLETRLLLARIRYMF